MTLLQEFLIQGKLREDFGKVGDVARSTEGLIGNMQQQDPRLNSPGYCTCCGGMY